MNSHTQVFWNNPPASAACLCGVSGVHGNDSRTSLFHFVREQLPEHSQTRISSRQGKVRVLYHKVEGEIFNGNKAVIFCELPCGFVPEVKALVLDMFVNPGNLKGGFASSVTALLFSGQSALSNAQTRKFSAQPARVINRCAVGQSQQRLAANIDTDGRAEVQFLLRVGYFALQTNVPFPKRFLQNDVLDLCAFGQEPVILHLYFTDVLHIEHGSACLVGSQFTAIAVPVFERVEPILALKAGEARCLTCFNTAEESPKAFVQPPEQLLYTCGIEQPQCVGVGSALIPKVRPLVGIRQPLTSGLICLNALFQRRVVKQSALLKNRIKSQLLGTAREQAVFVGSGHLSVLCGDIPLDGFFRNVAYGANVIRRRPQGFESLCKTGKALAHHKRGVAFKQVCQFCRAIGWSHGHEQVNMVGHNHKRFNVYLHLLGLLVKQSLERSRIQAAQQFNPVFGTPNKVVFEVKNAASTNNHLSTPEKEVPKLAHRNEVSVPGLTATGNLGRFNFRHKKSPLL